jgi:glutamate formiminotransferase
MSARVLASAVNVSEGREAPTVDRIASACGDLLLDVHRDADHNRSVLTLAGAPDELLDSVQSLVQVAVDTLDLTDHTGVHPRFGVVDVVPFTPVGSTELAVAIEARDRLAIWAGAVLGVPCFLYGPMPDGGSRSLPAVRRGAFTTLRPDTGPDRPHASGGAMAVGARGPLVAYNLWVTGLTPAETRAVAAKVRGGSLRALGLVVGEFTQVSCNLVDPDSLGPAEAYDRVATALPQGARIVRAELVGLVPSSVLTRTAEDRWPELGLSAADALEARLADRALRKLRS